MNNDWKIILEKVKSSNKWSETMMKVFASKVSKRKWKIVSFRGEKGGESRGIIDLLAIRKNHQIPKNKKLKRGDLFDIILIQLKGGSASKPSQKDIIRLNEVKKYYHASQIALFEWLKNKKAIFYILKNKRWIETSPSKIFN